MPGLAILRGDYGCGYLGDDAETYEFSVTQIPGFADLTPEAAPLVANAMADELVRRYGSASPIPGILRDPNQWGLYTFYLTADQFSELTDIFNQAKNSLYAPVAPSGDASSAPNGMPVFVPEGDTAAAPASSPVVPILAFAAAAYLFLKG